MVPSLTQFLGLGQGPPWTVYISLVPVQTGSRWSLHILFIYLFKIKDGELMWDGTSSSSLQRARCTAQDARMWVAPCQLRCTGAMGVHQSTLLRKNFAIRLS